MSVHVQVYVYMYTCIIIRVYILCSTHARLSLPLTPPPPLPQRGPQNNCLRLRAILLLQALLGCRKRMDDSVAARTAFHQYIRGAGLHVHSCQVN